MTPGGSHRSYILGIVPTIWVSWTDIMSTVIHRGSILHFRATHNKRPPQIHRMSTGKMVGWWFERVILCCLPFADSHQKYRYWHYPTPNALIVPVYWHPYSLPANWNGCSLWRTTTGMVEHVWPHEKFKISNTRKISKIFLDELLRSGTTTALVFGTVHPESIDAFFEEALDRNLRMIAGKVMMDATVQVPTRHTWQFVQWK